MNESRERDKFANSPPLSASQLILAFPASTLNSQTIHDQVLPTNKCGSHLNSMQSSDSVERFVSPVFEPNTAARNRMMATQAERTEQKIERKKVEHQPYFLHTKEGLDPYRPHQKICLEMKYAHEFVGLLPIYAYAYH